MQHRPQSDANKEWMACNPHDTFGRARHPSFLAYGGRVRRGQSNHRQQKGGKHKYDRYRLRACSGAISAELVTLIGPAEAAAVSASKKAQETMEILFVSMTYQCL